MTAAAFSAQPRAGDEDDEREVDGVARDSVGARGDEAPSRLAEVQALVVTAEDEERGHRQPERGHHEDTAGGDGPRRGQGLDAPGAAMHDRAGEREEGRQHRGEEYSSHRDRVSPSPAAPAASRTALTTRVNRTNSGIDTAFRATYSTGCRAQAPVAITV